MLLSKVHEGTGSVFFSYARMYLAVPIVLMLMVSFISINQKRWLYVFISAALVFCIVNTTTLKQQIRKCLTEDHVVSVLKTELVNSECSKLLSISKQNTIELIVILNH